MEGVGGRVSLVGIWIDVLKTVGESGCRKIESACASCCM
jgi:hypothetical protein